MKQYKDLIALLIAAEEDAQKFDEKGNNAAGSRVRKVMQEVKKRAQEIRVYVNDTKKQRKEEKAV